MSLVGIDRVTDPVTIVLLGEPVPWARAGGGKSGKRYTQEKQRNFAATLKMAAQDVMHSYSLHGKTYACAEARLPFDEPVSLDLLAEIAVRPSWSKRKQQRALYGEIYPMGYPDLDNLVKLAQDAMQTVVYRNDSRVCVIKAKKVYSHQPRLRITVAPIVTGLQ